MNFFFLIFNKKIIKPNKKFNQKIVHRNCKTFYIDQGLVQEFYKKN